MPGIQAASALLTAISILFASFAVVIRADPRGIEGSAIRSFKLLRVFSAAMISISFFFAVLLLRDVSITTDYPTAPLTPEVLFDLSTICILLALQGMLALLINASDLSEEELND